MCWEYYLHLSSHINHIMAPHWKGIEEFESPQEMGIQYCRPITKPLQARCVCVGWLSRRTKMTTIQNRSFIYFFQFKSFECIYSRDVHHSVLIDFRLFFSHWTNDKQIRFSRTYKFIRPEYNSIKLIAVPFRRRNLLCFFCWFTSFFARKAGKKSNIVCKLKLFWIKFREKHQSNEVTMATYKFYLVSLCFTYLAYISNAEIVHFLPCDENPGTFLVHVHYLICRPDDLQKFTPQFSFGATQ